MTVVAKAKTEKTKIIHLRNSGHLGSCIQPSTWLSDNNNGTKPPSANIYNNYMDSLYYFIDNFDPISKTHSEFFNILSNSSIKLILINKKQKSFSEPSKEDKIEMINLQIKDKFKNVTYYKDFNSSDSELVDFLNSERKTKNKIIVSTHLFKKLELDNYEDVNFVIHGENILKNKYSKYEKMKVENTNELESEVKKYTLDNGLYLNDILESLLIKKRYLHSLSVANVAVEISKSYNSKKLEKECLIVGLLHDIAKDFSKKNMLSYVSNDEINE
jgi:hypothetical protein